MSSRTSQTQVKQGQKTSPLLAIPAELRNHIYQILLVAPCSISLELKYDSSRDNVKIENYHEASPHVTILACCRQIHQEATAYLYSDNTFSMGHHGSTPLRHFMTQIRRSFQLLRHIDM